MSRNSADTGEGFTEMSKAAVVRGLVRDRLAAASREILAAVDELICGYEEEASGFRREIDRQRRQLETLQQPQFSCTKSGAKCSRSLCHVEEDEVEDEEDEPPVYQEKLEDSNNQSPSRSQFEKRKPGRPRISKTQKYVHLKICILEDSQTQLVSKNVLRKCPVLKLKCPRGLREAEFVDLLRATFPQLAGDNKPFDVLTSNTRQRLQRLRLKTVTPEEIQSNISCTDLGKSTLYIRLKAQKDPQFNKKENHPLQTQDISTKDFLSTSATLTCDDIRPHTSSLVEEVEGNRAVILSSSSTSQQDVETVEADDVDHIIAEPAEDAVTRTMTELQGAELEGEREEADELQSKKGKKQSVRVTETKTEISHDVLSCKVCGDLHKLEVTFVKHAWSHVDDLGSPCGVCGALSESAEALKDHLENHHKTEDCHICGESFLSVLSLNEHVAAHSGERPYDCNVCHRVFALKVSLENHQKLHEATKTHKCYTCHEVFALEEHLNAHYRSHANKKTHLCGVCGKSLSDYRSLSRHKFTHTGERPHSCQICGRRFKLIGALRQHEKTHLNRERSYLCDVCCKMFLTSKQLQIHMRTHTNEKPYHCSECGKGFTTRGPLTIHMRVHTGETPYRCPDCGWSFKRKSNLDDHLTVHSGVKAFVCGICGKACARKTHLTVHMRTHNGERPYKCTVCDKAFTQSHCLKTHMKSHLVGETSA